MADNADDVQSNEITLDDFMADEQDTAKVAPSAAETKTEEKATETKEESKADDTADEAKEEEKTETEAEPEDKTEEKADETETKPKGAEARKEQLNNEIRDLVSQRNALKTEVQKANEVYQPATEEELTAEGMSSLEAKVEAMRQQQEIDKYNEQVVEAQLTLGSEAQRVLSDFPIFNPDSDQFDQELAEEAANLLSNNLVVDENTNQIIGSHVSPYQLYKTLAKASGISEAKGQIKGQKDTEQMLANADTPTSTAPPKPKADPLMDLWTSED